MNKDEIVEAFQSVGFWVSNCETYLNQDILVISVTDRCTIKNKACSHTRIEFTGLEMMEGYAYIWLKITTLIFEYKETMKNLGGFERADVYV